MHRPYELVGSRTPPHALWDGQFVQRLLDARSNECLGVCSRYHATVYQPLAFVCAQGLKVCDFDATGTCEPGCRRCRLAVLIIGRAYGGTAPLTFLISRFPGNATDAHRKSPWARKGCCGRVLHQAGCCERLSQTRRKGFAEFAQRCRGQLFRADLHQQICPALCLAHDERPRGKPSASRASK